MAAGRRREKRANRSGGSKPLDSVVAPEYTWAMLIQEKNQRKKQALLWALDVASVILKGAGMKAALTLRVVRRNGPIEDRKRGWIFREFPKASHRFRESVLRQRMGSAAASK